MNTTYDNKFRLGALQKTMDTTLFRWGKVEPTLSAVANAIKGWQLDVENILYTKEYNNQATKNAQLALEEAWHNRDNRHLALKAANDARKELAASLQMVQDEKDEFVPAYVKKTMAYAMKSEAKPEPGFMELKNWVTEARQQLREIEMVPQNNRQYIAFNSNLEGNIYNNTTSRVKSWLRQNATQIYGSVTVDSQNAIKAVDQLLTEIEGISSNPYLTRQDKEQIFINVGKAYKMIDAIRVAPRTPAVKADLLHEVDRVRNSLNHVMPMLESGKYDERDLYTDVTNSINEVRRLGNALPYKALPEDTMENIYRADKALALILTDKRGSMRIKALEAAAANIDLIASDLAVASQKSEVSRDSFL